MTDRHARWSRREFVGGLTSAGALGALGVRPQSVSADPPPETTRIRLVQTTSMCQAPQYVAEALLRSEGFTDVQYFKKEGPEAIAGAVASGEADINMHFSGPLLIRIDRGGACHDSGGSASRMYELIFFSSMAASVGLDPNRDIKWVTYPADKAIELLAQGKIDAFMGFPPRPQELRARKIGHVLVNSNVDRPWSQYFCCAPS
jgi:NitT/TauT family transport system substrate-binding protein